MSTRIQNVKPEEYSGKKFRSTLEVHTAKALDALGIPYKYEGRKIILQEGFRCPYQKDKVRAITYTPDFEMGNFLLECKGFETPEWMIKKKLVYKYLQDNEPNTMFYQIHDAGKQLLAVLDDNLSSFGFKVNVTSKGTKKEPSKTIIYDSIKEAMEKLNLKGKPTGRILKALTGEVDYVYNYKWKFEKVNGN